MKPEIDLYNRAQRRVTKAMFEAQIRVEMYPMQDVSRSDILTCLRRGRHELGLTRQQVELLCYLSSWTDHKDWSEEGIPICTAHNDDIQLEFDIGRTRVKTLLRVLAEEGWIIYRDSPNGKRYRRRNPKTGQTVYAYGFDLSPLSRRYDELRQAAQAAIERKRETKRLHHAIMTQARRIYALIDAGRDMGLGDDEAAQYGTQAYALTQERGLRSDQALLNALVEKLSALVEALENRLSSLMVVESDPMGSPERPHYTTTNLKTHINVEKDVSKAAEPIEIRSSSVDVPPHPQSPLRGFKATPNFLLHIAPQFREFCSSSRPSQQEIIAAALMASDKLGISRHAWNQGNNVLGSYENAVAIAIIAARQTTGKIKSSGGYLRAMVNRHLEGDLAMDRTLYGLSKG
ncbi:plasmid replication protein RepC [Saccharibacter floricola]|uniref:Replication protein n=1 Tax=Saccharibacter floricola DSM 15669 TaxID=1123227 RepID=A0ABQ0P0T4_9PROT|nr:plasmid replication protein RepC [Saccharibacter floricola]GBQ08056.1 replication protein [Saccharibacter floricola DSM 15669]